MGHRVAIDIGGGFTDLVAVDERTGEILWSKGETSPADLTEGIENVFRMSHIDPAKTVQLLHGQTLVINSIVQRRGAKVGLITTRGFQDILELQRSNRRDIFNLRYKKPDPFVSRYMRLEVDERVMADGTMLRKVIESDVEAKYKMLHAEGADSIAICFINSYANPSNEMESLETIRSLDPDMKVTISSEVTREWREYERMNTAVLNAYVMPLVDGYLTKLSRRFRELGFNGALYMMLSTGGIATFDFVKRVPIDTVESGPVAGVVGGTKIAELVGEKNVIILDGGSTTTKASLVEDLTIRFTTNYAVERDEYNPGYPIKVPIVDIVEIGNGGGSVAWVDELGNLRVGPMSAGAVPGPACYGKGGSKPTVTDAYLAVGFLSPGYFLGGQFKLRPDLAQASLKGTAKHFGISVEQAAFAVIRLANDNAAQLLRLISVQRGYDPRDFALIAHGGSGPMLAPFIAEELEIPKIIVPVIPPGNFSAWGLLMSDLRYDVVKTNIARLDSPTVLGVFNEGFKALTSEVQSLVAGKESGANVLLTRTADLRYYGQEHTIRVPMSAGQIFAKDVMDTAFSFRKQHQREYGFTLEAAVELVNLHVTGVVPTKKPTIGKLDNLGRSLPKALKGERNVFWGEKGRVKTRVYERSSLPSGAVVRGPAIIEEPTTTTLVRSGCTARVDKYGNLQLEET
jgi:N-methylhydantoinase A